MITNKPALVKTIISVNRTRYKLGESIELNFEVSNINNEFFTFLPWNTPLGNKLTGNCLAINYNNKPIDYRGMMKRRIAPNLGDYIILLKNERVTGKVNLSKDHKFNKKGVYQVQFIKTDELPASNIITIKIN